MRGNERNKGDGGVGWVVLQEVPGGIGQLHVPQVEAEGVQPQACHVVDVAPYGLLAVHSESVQGTVCRGLCQNSEL